MAQYKIRVTADRHHLFTTELESDKMLTKINVHTFRKALPGAQIYVEEYSDDRLRSFPGSTFLKLV